METTPEYQVVMEYDKNIFEDRVNYLLKTNWSLIGGVSIMNTTNSIWYAQALFKNRLKL